MWISMLKIRRSQDRFIFNIGIPILVRLHLYIETAPRLPYTERKHNLVRGTTSLLKLFKSLIHTVWCRYNVVNFLTNIHRHPIARLLGAWYGVSSVDPACDWYSASAPLIIYVISYIRLRYNSTWLYLIFGAMYWWNRSVYHSSGFRFQVPF